MDWTDIKNLSPRQLAYIKEHEALYVELLASFNSLDQWLEPSEALLKKLHAYVFAPIEIKSVSRPDLSVSPKPEAQTFLERQKEFDEYFRSEPDTRTDTEKQTQKEFDENVYFFQAVQRMEENIKTSSKVEKVILIEKEIARYKNGHSYLFLHLHKKLLGELLQKKLEHFKGNFLNDNVIEERSLFDELTDSFYYLEQWKEPTTDLLKKLRRWKYLSEQPESVNKRENDNITRVASEEEDEYKSYFGFLKAVFYLEDRLKSLDNKDKIILLKKELEFDQKNRELYEAELPQITGLYTKLREEKINYFANLLNPKVNISHNSDQHTNSEESIKAYNRVADIFEKQPYWTTSLTDFVYCMNELALNGFLKANELEESIAERYNQKSQTTKKIQKTTVEKLKGRKRGIKSGDYTPSEKIERVTKTIISGMPSKKKS